MELASSPQPTANSLPHKFHFDKSPRGLIFALLFKVLTHGVMVTLLILVQSFMVRIHMGQQERKGRYAFPFLFSYGIDTGACERLSCKSFAG
jgi:hypothetical protein